MSQEKDEEIEEREVIISIPIRALSHYRVLTRKTPEEIIRDIENDDEGGLNVVNYEGYEFQDYEIDISTEVYNRNGGPTMICDPNSLGDIRVNPIPCKLLIEEIMNDIEEDRQNWEAFVSKAVYFYLKAHSLEELRELRGNNVEEENEEEENE